MPDLERPIIIVTNPERKGGTPCFVGTRIPVYCLLANLADNEPLDEIIANYPNITKEVAVEALRQATILLSDAATPDYDLENQTLGLSAHEIQALALARDTTVIVPEKAVLTMYHRGNVVSRTETDFWRSEYQLKLEARSLQSDSKPSLDSAGPVIITTNSARRSGASCFVGTSIPVGVLFEGLADGQTVDALVAQNPSLTTELAVEALLQANQLLNRAASPKRLLTERPQGNCITRVRRARPFVTMPARDNLGKGTSVGLKISYGLTLGEDATFPEAIEKITELRRYALTLGFRGRDDLPPVDEIEIGDASTKASPPTFWIEQKNGDETEAIIPIPATEWVGFVARPGKRCESVHFGLGRYRRSQHPTGEQPPTGTPTTTHDDDSREVQPALAEPPDEVALAVRGWSNWDVSCKTQYAYRNHGLDHFLHCHLALTKLLDHAQAIGILDYVDDDGDYWQSRSADVLVAKLWRYNQFLWGRAEVPFYDQIGEPGGFWESPSADALVSNLVANLWESDRQPLAGTDKVALTDHIDQPMEEACGVAVSPVTTAPKFDPLVVCGIVSRAREKDAVAGAPLLAWPAIAIDDRCWPSLAETIEPMQRLNPDLGLHIVKDRHGVSYLGHGKTARDVFEIVMPYRVPDQLAGELTEHNEHRRRININTEWTYVGTTRIERTSTGNLFIRPCTNSVRTTRSSLGTALAAHVGDDAEYKVHPGWCLLPEADGEELFEFEWSYWPDGRNGGGRTLREYWAVLPGGFFGIRDQCDISRAAFGARCQKAVDMGVPWCVLIDQDAHDLTVFRADGIERVDDVEDWSLREIPGLRWKQAWLA